jgi:MOSC domain-containing protein YiiM
MLSGELVKIFVTPKMGVAMKSVDDVEAIAGQGLKGDRYAEGLGAYSRSKPPKIRHVTLIGREAIERANQSLQKPLRNLNDLEFMTRRNLVTAGIDDLNELVDRTFTVGSVLMRGVEPCDPCKRPENLEPEIAGFKDAFENLGGLRAEILTSGMIAVRNVISTTPEPAAS